MNSRWVRCLGFLFFLGLRIVAQDENSWREQVVTRVGVTEEEREEFRSTEKKILWCKAEPVKVGSQEGFVVQVLARLPDGTRICGAMHFAGKQVEWFDPVTIANGRGVGFFGPYGKRRMLSGKYGFTLHYDPSKQPLALLEKPGIPLEEIVVRANARWGARDDEIREKAERRRFYFVYLRKVNLLESEQEENLEAVQKRERFVIGSEGAFDPIAWRRWVSDWRGRFHRKVFLEIMRAREERVVALRYPEAYSAIQSLYRWNMLLSKAVSREIFNHYGKEIHPDDTVGEEVVSLSVIRSKILASRGLLESVFEK